MIFSTPNHWSDRKPPSFSSTAALLFIGFPVDEKHVIEAAFQKMSKV
jgi:hypothetical protein